MSGPQITPNPIHVNLNLSLPHILDVDTVGSCPPSIEPRGPQPLDEDVGIVPVEIMPFFLREDVPGATRWRLRSAGWGLLSLGRGPIT